VGTENEKGRPANERAKQARRLSTEKKILDAVEGLVAESGFDGLGINTLAAAAGCSKELIYRYFGGLEGIIVAFMQRKDFWSSGMPLKILKDSSIPINVRVASYLKAYARSLRADPMFREARRWEISARSAALRKVAVDREIASAELLAALGSEHEGDIAAYLAIVQAGLTYLLLRAPVLPTFYGVTLTTEEGWSRIEAAIDDIGKAIFR